MGVKVKIPRHINWRRGAGEVLGFAVVLPMIFFLFCAIISVIMLTLAQQNMMFAAYKAARAAVVSDSRTDALKNASEDIGNILPGMQVRLLATAAEDSSDNYKGAGGATLQLLAEDPAGKNDWQKGNVLKVSVYKDITLYMPFASGVRDVSVVMMIENGTKMELVR